MHYNRDQGFFSQPINSMKPGAKKGKNTKTKSKSKGKSNKSPGPSGVLGAKKTKQIFVENTEASPPKKKKGSSLINRFSNISGSGSRSRSSPSRKDRDLGGSGSGDNFNDPLDYESE